MKFTSVLSDFNSNLWGCHFMVSEDITSQFVEGTNRRVLIRINGSDPIRSSLMPINKTESFILVNQELRSKLGLILGAEASIEIEKDESKYGMEMPDELDILLRQEEEVSGYFHELTPGKQRNLIYIVNKVKSTNSRLNKALAIVHHLKEMQGRLDFKILNETIKIYNSRNQMKS